MNEQFKMKANSYLQIDLAALRENVIQIQKEIGKERKLIPVLKANAYGLGAARLAAFYSGFSRIDTFAVSHVEEGVELRRAGIKERILVMSLPLDFQVEEAAMNNLILTLGSFRQFPVLNETARQFGQQIQVSLKLDTGLHRIGFLPSEAEELCEELNRAKSTIRIVDTFSHYMCDSEKQIHQQAACFTDFLKKLRSEGIDPGMCHMASSASLEADQDGLFDAVRVGRRLFLDNPERPTGKIREAASFRAYLTDVRIRRAGETLGYNSRVVLQEDTKVGVLSIGYGDGLDPALADSGAPVLVSGRRARLLASCMDQSFVDLGEIPCQAGDEVTLFGYDRSGALLSAQEVAALIGWEGCDLTARLTPRVGRIYVE